MKGMVVEISLSLVGGGISGCRGAEGGGEKEKSSYCKFHAQVLKHPDLLSSCLS